MFSAILWDNDGVLVDTEKYYFLATKEILAGVGVELTEEHFRKLFLLQSQGAWHLALEKGVSPEDIETLREKRNAVFLHMLKNNDIAIEGVGETLRRLKRSFQMGIVTSSHRIHFDAIHSRTNFLPYFNLVLTREDYTHSKPNPEPYLRATELLGMAPKEVLVIEDSERGMLAAKGAGLTCWIIPNRLTSAGDFSMADRVLTDIRDVVSVLCHPDRKRTGAVS